MNAPATPDERGRAAVMSASGGAPSDASGAVARLGNGTGSSAPAHPFATPNSGWLSDLSFTDLLRARFRPLSRHGARRALSGTSGTAPGRNRGQGSELESIGPYETGDDPRLIDWSATARTGQPQVRRMLAESEPALMIVVDLRRSMFFGSAHQLLARRACLTAAALVSQALTSARPCGLVTIGGRNERFTPRTSRRARAGAFHGLLRAYSAGFADTDQRAPPLDEALRELPRSTTGAAQWLVISDFSRIGTNLQRALLHLGPQRTDAIVIEDPLAQTPFPPGRYPVRDDSSAAGQTIPIRVRTTTTPDATRWRRALSQRLLRNGFGSAVFVPAHEGGARR